MKYVYPAIFHQEENGMYSIWFPDIKRGATHGDTFAEGIDMATDFLNLAVYWMEHDGIEMPTPSKVHDIALESNEVVTFVAADTEVYRKLYDTKLVKKTLNIPYGLNEQAIAANINFSKLLQTALKEKLQSVSVD